jgi:hypothetical protein
VATPVDKDVTDKQLKYKSLYKEIKHMWNVKRMIVPVITGANGRVTKCSKKSLEDIPWKRSIDSLLVTSHTIRKVLQCELEV